MNKGVSVILLAAGCVLVLYGVGASNSISSDMARFFTGAPTDKTLLFLMGGVIAVIFGFFGLMRGPRV